MKMSNWCFGIKQNYYFDDPSSWSFCGICSLYFTLSRIGFVLDPEDLVNEVAMRKGFMTLIEDGVTINDVQTVLKEFGIIGQHIRFEHSEKDLFFIMLSKIASLKRPVIVFPPGHAVSVIGVEGKFVYYIEPDNLSQIVSCKTLKEFERFCFAWRGFAEALPLIYCPSD
jgi:hypothetical protein